jgi:Tol biopolymer transport system component
MTDNPRFRDAFKRIGVATSFCAVIAGVTVFAVACGGSKSPSSPLIAFDSVEGGSHAIYVVRSDGTGFDNLINNVLDYGDYAWSPDGSELAVTAYCSATCTDIYVVSADGKTRRRLTHGGLSGGVAWSPDGKQIVFERTLDPINGPNVLYAIRANGTGLHRFTRRAISGVEAWSPTGKELMIDAVSAGIYVVSADGSNLHRLTANNNDGLPAWSPDGRKILFIRNSYSRKTGLSRETLIVINPDGTGATKLSTGTLRIGDPASWSPNGKLLVFSGARANCDSLTTPRGCEAIFVMRGDGTGLRRMTPYWAVSRVPSWSPDGTQIAFTGSRLDDNGDDNEGNIYLMQSNGTRRHLLLRQPRPWWTQPLVWQPSR